ncbi:MAG: aspartate/glutamate racemase family protein [Thermomicrobiales bacterium]|nr:aspartate/glutamate racemase family protein [Thermomicrobiales bacterium]
MYGERGRIGLITLATDTSVLPEYQRAAPPGVAVYAAPIVLPRGEVTPEALDAMLADDRLERAAALLVWAGVGVVVFACTSGSLIHGVGWDRRLVARIETACGLPATTTATAVLAALRAVGAEQVAVATPYLDRVNAIERTFLEDSRFAVAAIEGLQCATDSAIGQLGPEDAMRAAARVDRPAANALFISCTNWHCLAAVPALEARHGKPVVTSNLAGIWVALRRLGIADALPQHGRLLTLPAEEGVLT